MTVSRSSSRRAQALQRTAWLLTNDWALAQDLVQTALARAWPYWDRIRRGDDPEIYVRRVMVNTWATWRRRRWRGEQPSEMVTDRAAPGDLAADVATRLAVRSLLAALTDRQRAVVVLRLADDLSEAQVHRTLRTVIRATATGRVTDSVSCPWRSAAPAIYPLAADSHQRFFMVCTAYDHNEPSGARIYQFRVTRTGQVRGYALIPGGKLGAVSVIRMAVTPSGSELAVIVSPPRPSLDEIVVINTRTGARATWRNPPAASHAARFRVFDVSLADNGRQLVFLGARTCGTGPDPALCKPRDTQVRAFGPATRGGLIDTGRVLLRRPRTATAFWMDAAISADGSTLTIVTTSAPPKPQLGTVTVWQVLLRTRQRRIIYQDHGTEYFFRPDATGRHFVIDAGPAGHPANGWIRHDSLAPLQPRPGKVWIFYEAW